MTLAADVPPGQVDRRHVRARAASPRRRWRPRPRRGGRAADGLRAGRQGRARPPTERRERGASDRPHAARSTPAHAAPAGRSAEPQPGGVALGPEVTGDAVLHVGHGRRLARGQRRHARRAARRRRRSAVPSPQLARTAPGMPLRSPRCTAARAWSTPVAADAEQADQVRVRTEAAVADADPELRAQAGPPPGRGACRPP